MLFIQLLK